jgi:hypothetical protein
MPTGTDAGDPRPDDQDVDVELVWGHVVLLHFSGLAAW